MITHPEKLTTLRNMAFVQQHPNEFVALLSLSGGILAAERTTGHAVLKEDRQARDELVDTLLASYVEEFGEGA